MIRQLLSDGLSIYQEGRVGSKVTVGKQRLRTPPHPWSVVSENWFKGDFGPAFKNGGAWCLVLRPGFVNGIDPMVKSSVGVNQSALSQKSVAIASSRQGLGTSTKEVYVSDQTTPFLLEPSKRKNRPLLDGPLMAINFSIGKDWPGDKLTPLKIQDLGVPARPPKGDDMFLSGDSVVSVASTEAADPTKKCIAKSVDLVLGMARPALKQNISFSGDAGIVTGRLITYQMGFDTTVIDALGWRPFIYQVTDYDALILKEKQPDMMDIIMGNPGEDDQLDKLHLLRVWAISPPQDDKNPSTTPDDSWRLFYEHKCFWNLSYDIRLPKLYAQYPPISYHSGLAFGLGDAIVNSYLALQDDLMQRVFNGVTNGNNPKGRFWNV